MNYGFEFDLVVRISMNFSLTIAEFFMSTFHFYVFFKNRSLVLIRIVTVSVIEMINKFLWFIYIRSYEHIRHFGKLFFFLYQMPSSLVHIWASKRSEHCCKPWMWCFYEVYSGCFFSLLFFMIICSFLHIECFFLPQNKMQIQENETKIAFSECAEGDDVPWNSSISLSGWFYFTIVGILI